MSSPRPVLAAARRTVFGKSRGGLSGIRPDDLLGLTIAELVGAIPSLDQATIDDVIMGDANGAGEDNRNVARMSALLAGLPVTVPGMTINRLCGSGAEALIQAFRAVRAGDMTTVIAGGVESMSRAPFVLPKSDKPLECVPNAVPMPAVLPAPRWTSGRCDHMSVQPQLGMPDCTTVSHLP
jgi:acetyl-CoA acetyltransferase